MNRADQEPDQKQRRDGEGRDIDGAVLPQFASHRPVQAPARGDRHRHSYVGFEWRHGFRLRIHRAAPLDVVGLIAGLIANDGNEQVGYAGRAHIAKGGELLTIDMIEQAGCCDPRPRAHASV